MGWINYIYDGPRPLFSSLKALTWIPYLTIQKFRTCCRGCWTKFSSQKNQLKLVIEERCKSWINSRVYIIKENARKFSSDISYELQKCGRLRDWSGEESEEEISFGGSSFIGIRVLKGSCGGEGRSVFLSFKKMIKFFSKMIMIASKILMVRNCKT